MQTNKIFISMILKVFICWGDGPYVPTVSPPASKYVGNSLHRRRAPSALLLSHQPVKEQKPSGQLSRVGAVAAQPDAIACQL
jgi:hypothetical protein